MGTDDTTLRYSKSKMGTAVLHFQGYAYLKNVKRHRKTQVQTSEAEDDKVLGVPRKEQKVG